MAPPRKASVRKGKQPAARTSPVTPRSARQPRRRSASPPNQPTPIAIRDEPPARSTRSWVSAAPISNVIMPTAEQRNPVDCPFVRCRAVTEHQHLPQLQYYRPRPDRAVQYRGFGNSGPRIRPARRTARQDDDASPEAPVVAGNEEVPGHEQEAEEQEVAAGGNENDTQDLFTGEMGQNASQSGPSSEEISEVEERLVALDDGVTDDTVHYEGESSLRQALMTPPPSSPPVVEEEPAAQASPSSSEKDEQQEHSPSPVPQPQRQNSNDPTTPEPQNNAAIPPTQHIHTLDELIRPLVDPTLAPAPSMEEITRILQTFRSPRDPSYRPGVDPDDLPSLMLREDDVDLGEIFPSLTMGRERETGYRDGVPHFDVGEWEDAERVDWEEEEAEREGW